MCLIGYGKVVVVVGEQYITEKVGLSLLDGVEEVRQRACERPEHYTVGHVLFLCEKMVSVYTGTGGIPEHSGLALLDGIERIRKKMTQRPQNYPVDYTVRVLSALIAEQCGYDNRVAWTKKLLSLSESRYYRRYHGIKGQFHL